MLGWLSLSCVLSLLRYFDPPFSLLLLPSPILLLCFPLYLILKLVNGIFRLWYSSNQRLGLGSEFYSDYSDYEGY